MGTARSAFQCLAVVAFPDFPVGTLGFVPGVPSLVSRRKMTLKLNYIYMKVL
jgi:hypothetical protein